MLFQFHCGLTEEELEEPTYTAEEDFQFHCGLTGGIMAQVLGWTRSYTFNSIVD